MGNENVDNNDIIPTPLENNGKSIKEKKKKKNKIVDQEIVNDYSLNNIKKKNSKSVIIISLFFILLVLAILAFFGYRMYNKYVVAPTPIVNSIKISNDNILKINFSVDEYKLHKEIYCLFNITNKKPSVNDKNWVLSKNNECSISLDDNVYYGYLKNYDGEIIKIDDVSEYGKITKLDVNKEKIYLAKSGIYKLSATFEKIGNVDSALTWSSDDESIAKGDENGNVIAIKSGNTKIRATIGGVNRDVDVLVTDLITTMPKNFNNSKPYLSCGKYTKEQNDLLDEILKDRINDAGYKTRAGVVAAARFLALEFPYKIRYFSENGRETTNGIQGEGRYYNVGLYLDESRYFNIKKPMNGKATWGCQIYSRPSKGYRANGLDCSGYITWVMLNGGFDVKDVGAGVSGGVLDLTDYGKKTRFTNDILNSGKIKVGDLLSSEGPAGGHIALIVGEDSNYYYVTESLWTPPNVSVTIIPYPKTSAIKKKTKSSRAVVNDRYYWVMLMDDYYKEDGNLTTLWY